MKRETSKTNQKPLIAFSLLLLIAAAGLSAAARLVPGFAQWYSVTVYPVLVRTVGRLTGALPFSAAEALCAILPLIILAGLIRALRRRSIRAFFARLFLLLCLLFFLYSANCNINYYRDPFVPEDIYESAGFTNEELADFCEFILGQLEASSAELAASETNTPESLYPTGRALADSAISAMNRLAATNPSLDGFYPQPKQLTFMSRFFSQMGVSGIYSPFTIEANINGEMQGMEKPFTACHELSHLRGFMNEGEANFIGWLACISSEDPAFERSGWLIAWNHAASSLHRADPATFQSLAARLPSDVIAELQANHTFWVTHETKASEIQDQLNDAYLKTNGQADGIQTYSHLTTLMLLWYNGML